MLCCLMSSLTANEIIKMGYGPERGIIPLICEALFERITAVSTDRLTFTVEVCCVFRLSGNRTNFVLDRYLTSRSIKKKSETS